jgi:hypothetical protein
MSALTEKLNTRNQRYEPRIVRNAYVTGHGGFSIVHNHRHGAAGCRCNQYEKD